LDGSRVGQADRNLLADSSRRDDDADAGFGGLDAEGGEFVQPGFAEQIDEGAEGFLAAGIAEFTDGFGTDVGGMPPPETVNRSRPNPARAAASPRAAAVSACSRSRFTPGLRDYLLIVSYS
jgi:hypothetical protein